MQIIDRGADYVLSNCSKFLARDYLDARHNDGQYPVGDPRGFVGEAWRFPIVDSWADGTNFVDDYWTNSVTFVYRPLPGMPSPASVAVIGTFARLFEPVPMPAIPDTPYFALTVLLPKGRAYTYQYVVDGQPVLDPINPQRTILDNNREWSRFFTQLCTDPLILEDWELSLLTRITERILPFHTDAGRDFLHRYYDQLTDADKPAQLAAAYRLDEPVGVVNFIDKLLAREEAHRLADYRICLRQIDIALRQRDPYVEPSDMPDGVFDELYQEMASDNVAGWDKSAYESPSFFLKMLRRHTYTGAFSHPKYGGNVGASGWAYLEERYRDQSSGATLFNWRRIMEQPLGDSVDYHG